MMIQDATERQNRASRPESSTWVSANAGSGKTRVLTDRVARLLLVENKPEKILCLTYTKAAAAEMQNRLFKRLGEWAMMDGAGLRAALSQIGENGDNYNDAALRRTRTHFARALETPGGLKIQTIHAFCASLLRRFPIEAGVSPQFKEMEEGQAALLRASILDAMARDEDTTAFDALARHLTNEDGLQGLLIQILKHKNLFESFDREVMARALGVDGNITETAIHETAMAALKDSLSDALIAYLTSSSTGAEVKAGHALTMAVKETSTLALQVLETGFLTQAKTPIKRGLPSADTKKKQAAFAENLETIKETVFNARQEILALRALNRAQDLHRFASRFIADYEAAKATQSLLDFDDLIDCTRGLLSSAEMTQWVLYRLDNGIDHILVDEAQDTSPSQWDIVQNLSEEFTSGQGASEVNRTLFVVGDKKQSIFGFQGADPDEFHTKQDLFADRFSQAGKTLDKIELPTSFRSARPVLRLVDQVFSDDMGALGGAPTHMALEDTPGRVDLWPFKANEKNTDDFEWWQPVDTISNSNPVNELALQTADYIADQINAGTPLHTKDGSRPVKPGDYLILVRSRSRYFHILIDALKANGVPVAGADRMRINEQLAVRDLLSLLRFLDNELDDLSLAEALRSPIFNLSEADLFHLAHARKGTLWDSLRKSTHANATEILGKLRKSADFIRPYELLTTVLTEFGARKNLTARLGMECEDAIDELLSQAIAFERLEAPTLGGFLYWLSARDVQIKRDMEAGRNEVRVMTVHGAKGLEAPIVIVPDTSTLESGRKKPPIGELSGQAFWAQPKENEPQAILDMDDAQKRKDEYEYARLLYVALTRAENWLIVAGAGQPSKDAHRWHNRVSAAMEAMGAVETGGILTVSHLWDGAPDADATVERPTLAPAPWLHAKPDAAPDTPSPVSPSRFDGPHALPGDYEADGTRRGDLIHQLLEFLPTTPRGNWPDLTRSLCADAFDPEEILAEVSAVLKAPEFTEIFSETALVEVPITARLAELDDKIISGRIDRLLLTPNRVLAVDFKSNLVVPAQSSQIPKAILAQQGAYAVALGQIYPDRIIETAIIWTKTAQLMKLPHATVIDALRTVTSS